MPSFAHLNLTVADVERSAAFYARWFGFDQRPETYSDDTRFVRNRHDFDLAFLPGVPPSPPAPTVHFGFRTASADEVRTLLGELRAAGVTVVLTTHYLEEAEALSDHVHIIDRGALIVSGSPLELTRGGTHATIRLVVTRPFPVGAPESLRRALGEHVQVTQLDAVSVLVDGPADSSTLGLVSQWCLAHDIVPESLELGRRNLEDVFLELTGRGLER